MDSVNTPIILEQRDEWNITYTSPLSILKIACGIVFRVQLMICAPIGWIYDLWVGMGTGQGQTPDQTVSMIHTQADAADSHMKNIPVTTFQECLIACSLLCLQNISYTGEQSYKKNDGTRMLPLTSTSLRITPPTRSEVSDLNPTIRLL